MVAKPNTRSVLVVDDDEFIGNVLSRVLERDGYAVLRANSPAAAVALAGETVPDAALLDLCYPDGDGVALADDLRSLHAGLPLILMTAYPLRLRDQREVARPFHSVLHKPINLEELRRALDAALSGRASPPPAAAPERTAHPPSGEENMDPAKHPRTGDAANTGANERGVGPPAGEAAANGPRKFLRSVATAAVVLAVLAVFAGFVLRVPLPWQARATEPPTPKAPPASALASVELVPGMPHTLLVPDEVRQGLGIREGPSDQVAPARRPTRSREMVLPGSTALDPTRLWRIRARFAPARVTEIAGVTDVAETEAAGRTAFRELTTGDRVRKGDLLAVVYSADVGNKKNDLVDALYQLRLDEEILRLAEKAAQTGAVPEVFMLNAKRAVEGDRNNIARALSNLRTWEIPDEDIRAVYKEAEEIAKRGGERDKSKDEQWPRVELQAPEDGVVVERNIARAEMIVDQTVNLFQIARVDRLTVLANCPEDDLPALHALHGKQRGWTVRTVGAADAKGVTGPITEIGYLIDPNQHTAVVKGFIDNPRGLIRAGQFVTATVQLSPPDDVVEVPVSAVVDDGQQSVVFVQTDAAKHIYMMRRVELANRYENTVFVRSRPFAKDEQPRPEELELGMLPKEPLRPGERILQTGVGELKAALSDKECEPNKERREVK
jgi:cobalt-zinc-cadmium efflux system membrane fusion protein